MSSVTITCETITPMFLAGADGITPELRPPSLKGLLRFWWRAIQSENDINKLKQNESVLFGSSDEKIGRSKVILRILSKLENDEIGFSLWDEIPSKPRFGQHGKTWNEPIKFKGIAYLLYSTFMLNKRSYIKPETEFKLKIEANDEDNLKKVVHAFWCLAFLGGIGTRSRRGGGNIRVKEIDNKSYNDLFQAVDIANKSDLKSFFDNRVKDILISNNTIYSPSDYAVLKGTVVYIFDHKTNWKDALNKIGEPFADFRRNNKRRIKETPNFGFPVGHSRNTIIFGAGKIDKSGEIKLNKKGEVDEFLERSASPLIFKIIKTKEKTYFPIIIRLNKKLIPNDYRICDKFGNNYSYTSDKIINDFFKILDIDKVEVKL